MPTPTAFYPTPNCFHHIIYNLLPNRNLCMCGKKTYITAPPNQHVAEPAGQPAPWKHFVGAIAFIPVYPYKYRHIPLVIVLWDGGVDGFTVFESLWIGCLLTHCCLPLLVCLCASVVPSWTYKGSAALFPCVVCNDHSSSESLTSTLHFVFVVLERRRKSKRTQSKSKGESNKSSCLLSDFILNRCDIFMR